MEPKTRKEHYLAKIAGEDVTIPEPKTRQEHYLKEIAENGGGSSGGGIFAVTTSAGGEPGTFANANHNATEIMEALDNNQLPVLFFHMESGGEKHTTPANYKTFGGGGGNPWYVTFTVGGDNDIRVNDDYSVELVNS